MNRAQLTVAERIACSICWLARQPGLPEIHALRFEVESRHAEGCSWCDYPLPMLLDLARIDEGANDAKAFMRLSPVAQRDLVAKAIHA